MRRAPPTHSVRRRGTYGPFLAIALPVFIGFAALAVDIAYMRLTHRQTQDVADAAAAAAMYTMRNERSRTRAEQAALQTCAVNVVAGAPPACSAIEFGERVAGAFAPSELVSSAVRVEASRVGGASPGLFFSRFWGWESFEVAADAVAEARPLEIVVVVDITISWHPNDFTDARAAAVRLLDTLELTAGDADRIGLVVFNGSYGWEYTPFTRLRDMDAIAEVRTAWSQLALASYAGDPADCPWPQNCNGKKYTGEKGSDFDNPPGGFYPHMPRNYPGEPATDYYPGLLMAQQMFIEGNPQAFRGMVVLTDGKPYQVRSNARANRTAAGHVETRFRQADGPYPHSKNDIVADTIDQSADMWDFLRTHTWMISFVKDNSDLAPVARGIGYYQRVDDGDDLIRTFQTIAESLPIVLTE